jgi:hypothetical protein
MFIFLVERAKIKESQPVYKITVEHYEMDTLPRLAAAFFWNSTGLGPNFA